jgi:hypothetical protein
MHDSYLCIYLVTVSVDQIRSLRRQVINGMDTKGSDGELIWDITSAGGTE